LNKKFGSSADVVIWVAAILLIIAVGLFIAAPLSDHVLAGRGSALSAESKWREHEHALAVQALRELEFDQAMGKLDASDYRALRERLENRALAAMSEREKTPRQSFDRVAPTRTVTVNFCHQCGTRIGRAHSFCANCGERLAVTSIAMK
jgi:cytochrome c-type biogenesis protein CcmI